MTTGQTQQDQFQQSIAQSRVITAGDLKELRIGLNNPLATGAPEWDEGQLNYDLLSIKALIDAAHRAIWQDGTIAEDIGLVTDAAFLLESASRDLSGLIERTT